MRIYTTPTRITAASFITSSSSSAPLSTKNRANRGAVHLSARSIRS